MFSIKVVALVFGGEVGRHSQGPRQREKPGASGAQRQARWVRRERDARGVVRQVLELLLLWPQGGRGVGDEGERRGSIGKGRVWLLEEEKTGKK